MKEDTHMLILGGIHGAEDGQFGPTDEWIENQTLFHIRQLEEEKADDVNDYPIKFTYEPVGDLLDEGKLNHEKMVKVIMKHKPTVLLLAFCYTNQSILNDCLKSQGVYSMLIMQRDRKNITEGRCIFLDDQQQESLFTIAEQRPSLVLLQGTFGTGKTILLMEALRIKIAQYQEEKRSLKIIVTSDTRQAALMAYLKSNFKLADDINVEYYDCLKDVYVGDSEEKFGLVTSVSDLNKCIKRLSNWQDINDQVILVIDEFFVKGKMDWTKFSTKSENVDILFSFHFGKESQIPFILPDKKDKKVVCCTLSTVYRNSSNVLKLCSFLSSHIPSASETYSTKRYKILDPDDIQRGSQLLPPGHTPVWIHIRSNSFHPIVVFNYIQFHYLKELTKVSFIIDDSHTHSEDVKEWLNANGYSQHTSSEFAQVAFSFEHSMRGLEDEVIHTLDYLDFTY